MLATLAAVRNGYYTPSEDPTIKIEIPPPGQPSEAFIFADLPPASTTLFERTSVSVIKRDCLLEALHLKEHGFRPVVLNMASVSKLTLKVVVLYLKGRSLTAHIMPQILGNEPWWWLSERRWCSGGEHLPSIKLLLKP